MVSQRSCTVAGQLELKMDATAREKSIIFSSFSRERETCLKRTRQMQKSLCLVTDHCCFSRGNCVVCAPLCNCDHVRMFSSVSLSLTSVSVFVCYVFVSTFALLFFVVLVLRRLFRFDDEDFV